MNLEANSNRHDEIIFPHDMTMIMQKVNAQLVEFNIQGSLVAIGCRYGGILIMDFLTKEIVRCFSLYENYDYEANKDVDQFSHFRRLNYAYLEDDFILHQKPQDEKDIENPVKRDFKKVIQFEPKDKSKCKAQIASIDWSIDSKLIAVCFKIENQVVVWNVDTCQKIYHLTPQELIQGNQINNVHQTYFLGLNPNVLLLSGDKSWLVNINEGQQEQVFVSDQAQQLEPPLSKLEASPQAIIQGKRKGPKYSSYILQSLYINEERYFLLIANLQKLIYLLKDKTKNSNIKESKAEHFFQVIRDKEKEQENDKMEVDANDESKDSSEEKEDDLEKIKFEELEDMNQDISLINQSKFQIVGISKFQNLNSFIQTVSINDNGSDLLLSCSDRVLRLYEIKPENIERKKKVILLKFEFQDVINKRKWMNASFLRLSNNVRIILQTQNKVDFFSTGKEDKDFIGESEAHELFVSSIGESGSNELKFFDVKGHQSIQRLELSQEGCGYLTAHSRAHFSIVMVTTNGSIFLWSVRPAKIIQPLAPNFTEIEDNKEYVEKEDEFEKEPSDSENEEESKVEDEKKKQQKLSKLELDDTTRDPFHLCNRNQILIQTRPDLSDIDHVFDKVKVGKYKYEGFMAYLQVQPIQADTYGLLAKSNIESFRDKFKKTFNQA